ncbi:MULTISPECIES: hypothetical protein [unclassified Ensifer]|uniref:hypothetical protein n=1 Tax=unclassified Ensifer TaxID=2633371 RepID=UPI000813270C|nr:MULTISPECIES: hypothetical protein [unclassified Ensifer]OCP07956.1 hypothetical protein BC362_10120 [Ensifer sp. LC14]OCP10934.1 hypothetical protein BC374_17845 [Ensifer sp. LC13]OCP11523.1 hypothetical protein BBX50_18015 [Ensifer sp. LC11]OCP33339.1 hypothetical protein BC364_16900 [Ensifer sp. LC499]
MTDDREDKIAAVRRRMSERRARIFLPPYEEIAEKYLSELYPGLAKSLATHDIRQLYEGIRRRHADEIDADCQEYADVFLIDSQRTPDTIEAWAKAKARQRFTDDHDLRFSEAALRVAITVYVERHRAYRSRYSCDQGWHRIVERFVDAGIEHSGFQLWSAREKWGVLALSWEAFARPDDLQEAEIEAVEQSKVTCETCGRPGKLRKFHWRKTLCDEHEVGRVLDLSDEEYERLQRHFSECSDRWRPIIAAWEDEGLSADVILSDFLKTFADLDEQTRRYWAVSCTRLVLTRRARDEGRPRDAGI